MARQQMSESGRLVSGRRSDRIDFPQPTTVWKELVVCAALAEGRRLLIEIRAPVTCMRYHRDWALLASAGARLYAFFQCKSPYDQATLAPNIEELLADTRLTWLSVSTHTIYTRSSVIGSNLGDRQMIEYIGCGGCSVLLRHSCLSVTGQATPQCHFGPKIG